LLGNGDLITSLAAHLGDGVLTIDHNGRISFANESAAAITGYAKDEMMGQSLGELFPPVIETDSEFHPLTRAQDTKESVAYRSKPLWKEIDLIVIPNDHWGEANGSDVHSLIVLRSVSAKNELAEDLSHTARMRLMGQLTMGIAHDFNNALTSIICNTQLVG